MATNSSKPNTLQSVPVDPRHARTEMYGGQEISSCALYWNGANVKDPIDFVHVYFLRSHESPLPLPTSQNPWLQGLVHRFHALNFHRVKDIVEYIIESGRKREKRERERKHIMDYIVLSSLIKMDTRASLYRKERGTLTSNLTNMG